MVSGGVERVVRSCGKKRKFTDSIGAIEAPTESDADGSGRARKHIRVRKRPRFKTRFRQNLTTKDGMGGKNMKGSRSVISNRNSEKTSVLRAEFVVSTFMAARLLKDRTVLRLFGLFSSLIMRQMNLLYLCSDTTSTTINVYNHISGLLEWKKNWIFEIEGVIITMQ